MRWDKTFGLQGDDMVHSLAHTYDGGYILAGSSNYYIGEHSHSDARLVKTDANGNMQWQRTISDGGLILFGVTRLLQWYDCWLVKTVEMWNWTFGHDGDNIPYSILQSPDGGYIIAGKTESAGTEYYSDMWLASTDSDGYVQWEMTFGVTGPNVAARAVLLAPDGGLIVAGEKGLHTENDSDFWLAKFGGIPVEPESGDAPTDGESVQTPYMPGFGAAVAVMGLLVWVYLRGRRL